MYTKYEYWANWRRGRLVLITGPNATSRFDSNWKYFITADLPKTKAASKQTNKKQSKIKNKTNKNRHFLYYLSESLKWCLLFPIVCYVKTSHDHTSHYVSFSTWMQLNKVGNIGPFLNFPYILRNNKQRLKLDVFIW